MTKQELKLKIPQETYYIRKIFESCKTLEQVNNTNRLACFLVDKWCWHGRHFGLSDAIYLDKFISSAANDMESFLNQAKDRVLNRKNSVIPTGYWD